MKTFIFLTLFCFSAFATNPGQIATEELVGNIINAQTMAAPRTTATINVEGYAYLQMQVFVTAWVGATALAMQCQVTSDNVNWSNMTQIVHNTLSLFTPSMTLTGTTSWTIRPNISGYKWIRCTFTPSGGAAGDVFTVRARKQVGGC